MRNVSPAGAIVDAPTASRLIARAAFMYRSSSVGETFRTPAMLSNP